MIYPNIILLNKKREIVFYEKTAVINQNKTSILNNKARQVLKIPEILSNKDNCIIIINSNYEYLKNIVKILNSYNIKKIYFFINDVFRVNHPKFQDPLITHIIEKDIDNCVIPELEIIKTILRITKINCYEIFHCEHDNKLIEEKYNFKFKYYDIFLSNYCEDLISNNIFTNNFDYKISCFNHRREVHRHIISALLHNNADCLITYINKFKLNEIIENQDLPINKFNFPKELIKSLEKFDKANLHYIQNNQFVIGKSHTQIYLPTNLQQEWLIFESIEKSFLNVVTETRFSSLSAYISEKTLKPILMFRPFVLLSSYKTLTLLKKLGFQTFNKWWDESYDLEPNHVKRFEMVNKIITDILKCDSKELENLLVDMYPILLHNKNHIKNVTSQMLNIN